MRNNKAAIAPFSFEEQIIINGMPGKYLFRDIDVGENMWFVLRQPRALHVAKVNKRVDGTAQMSN